jgi:hypothetical protein
MPIGCEAIGFDVIVLCPVWHWWRLGRSESPISYYSKGFQALRRWVVDMLE